jgi:hypothetical protein
MPTEMREIIADATTSWGPLVVTSIQEDSFINGSVFSYEDYRTFATDEIANFIFNPTAFTGDKLIVLAPAFSATAGPVLVEYYAGVVESGDGVVLDVSNRRGTSASTPESTFKLNPTTISNAGVRFTGRLVPSTATTPINLAGATASGNLPFELNTTVKYLVRITNTNGDNTIIQTDFSWIEI